MPFDLPQLDHIIGTGTLAPRCVADPVYEHCILQMCYTIVLVAMEMCCTRVLVSIDGVLLLLHVNVSSFFLFCNPD